MTDNKSIHEHVAGAIRTGTVKMRPRWYFILQGLLFALGAIIVILLALFVSSFIIYMLQQTGVAVVPGFGLRGWYSFARHLPWLLVVLSLAFTLIVEVLVRRYSFAYRRPLAYSVVGVIGIVIAGGFVLAHTSVHPRLMLYAQQHRLPFGERLYRDIDERQFGDVFKGIVVATTSEGFIIEHRFGTSSVLVTHETRQPLRRPAIPGDFVIILGDQASDTITAVGIRPRPKPMRLMK